MEYSAFLLAVLGLMQFYFLPGAALLGVMKYRSNPMQFFIFSAGISLVFNYALVYLLVCMGAFSNLIIYCVLAIELLSLLFFARAWMQKPLRNILSGRWSTWLGCLAEGQYSTLNVVLFMLALGVITFLIFNIYFHFGDVFSVNDEKDSWNLWALIWSGGYIPGPGYLHSPGVYPQLIPTNYALLYNIIGHSDGQPYLVFFARNMMPVFFILQLLIVLDLAIKTKQQTFLMGMVLLSVLTFSLVGKYIPRGYVDIPLATMTCVAGYPLLAAWFCDAKFSWREVIIMAVACAGCGVTKQGGLFMSILFPLFTYLQLKDECLEISAFCYFVLSYSIIFAVVVPWYLHVQLAYHGFTVGNTVMLVEIKQLYGGHDGLARYLWEFKKIAGNFFIFLMFAGVAMFRDHRWRALMCFSLLYIILWFVFVGYTPRNLTLVFPFVALSASAGVVLCLQNSSARLARYFSSIPVGIFVLLFVVLLVVLSASKHLRYSALLKKQQLSVKRFTGETDPQSGRFAYYPYKT